jgi:transcriptional regulatory protein LevR
VEHYFVKSVGKSLLSNILKVGEKHLGMFVNMEITLGMLMALTIFVDSVKMGNNYETEKRNQRCFRSGKYLQGVKRTEV